MYFIYFFLCVAYYIKSGTMSSITTTRNNIVKINNGELPFDNINNDELSNIYSSDTLGSLDSLPNFDIVTDVSEHSYLQSAEIDINMAFQSDCKYYSVDDFQKLKNYKSFNLFHSNVNSLESKFGNFHQFVASTPSKFHVLALTETSQKAGVNFKSNVKIDGYDLFKTPSNSDKGGTVLYLSNSFKPFERVDLKIQHDDFESTWGEINNSKSRNSVWMYL